jgi:pyruvate dehydrogenase E2 component (dihydrolipoamide acetyltransferase)
MPFTLTMPKLSPTMEQGTLVKWHKKVGDSVQPGDVLFDVATDKATVEYNALDEGWIRQILVQEGQEAIVNQPIAVLTAEQNESLEGYQPIGVAPRVEAKKIIEPSKAPEEVAAGKMAPPMAEEIVQKKEGAVFAQPQFIPEPPLERYAFESPTVQQEKRILASPLAKKLAKEKGLDLSTIKGTGPNQRIMSRDLAKAQPLGIVDFTHRAKPSVPPGSYEEQPLSPMRKIIGQRLQESKTFIPHFYITQIIDAAPLVAIREQLKNHEVKFTINDFIVRACALALRQHPNINCGFNSVNQSIIQFKTIDIAIAVSLESGLITPIVRHADYKNLGELSLEIRMLAQKAREGKLNPQDYKGGSFTISNLGMYGISDFSAILNPPQSAILAVSGIQDVPVVHQGEVVAGKTLNLTLSVDHRVIDGAAAALFLQTLKKLLENPAILLAG